MSKYSLTSWPEVIVVFHGEYKGTVTHILTLSHCRTTCTTASESHRVELKRPHFHEVEVRDAQFVRVDEHCHRSTCVVERKGSHSWNVSPDKSSATRCNHKSTTRALSPSEYLVPLYSSHSRTWNSKFFSTQLILPWTVPSLQIQKCPDHMLVSSSVDHTSWAPRAVSPQHQYWIHPTRPRHVWCKKTSLPLEASVDCRETRLGHCDGFGRALPADGGLSGPNCQLLWSFHEHHQHHHECVISSDMNEWMSFNNHL